MGQSLIAVGDQDLAVMPRPTEDFVDLGVNEPVFEHGWRPGKSLISPGSVHFDDGLDHARLGPGVRREDVGQLVERARWVIQGFGVDLAVLDQADDPA